MTPEEWALLRPTYVTDTTAWTPEARKERAIWRAEKADESFFTMEAYRHLYEKYAERVPAKEFDHEGQETLQSMANRAKIAYRLGLAETGSSWRQSPYTYAALRVQMQPAEKQAATQARKRLHEERFHEQAPAVLVSMGLGERLVGVLGDLTETRETLLVHRWLFEGKRWAFILSGVGGAGKSVALASALQRFCREEVRSDAGSELQWRPRKGRYVLAGDLLGGPAFGAEAEERIRKLSTVPLLCIDDLGTETLTDVSRDLFFRILDARYRGARSKLTLLATNLSWGELVQRYGERFKRRLDKDREEGAAFLPIQHPFARPEASQSPS